MQTIIYTDGSYSWSRQVGRYAFVVTSAGKKIHEVSSKEDPDTTHNRMEMQAVLDALKYAKSNGLESVTIFTDSMYCKDGYESWVTKWSKNKWKKSGKELVKNVDLWKDILALKRPSYKVKHVKGHNGDKWNEYVDKLAKVSSKKMPMVDVFEPDEDDDFSNFFRIHM